jgi:16S rRNA (cytosine967-C5)-methyltransferase
MTRDDLLAQVGANGRPGRWSPYAVHLTKGDPGAIDAVRNGRAGVQDEGSQLAALALVAADVAGPERRWLDTCAGPGGKAALLAGHAAERGAHLLAADRSMHRAGLAAAAIGAAAGTLVVTADGTRPAWPAGTFDRVLVDAPCTGLGALRRRPEARWRRSREDADRLQPMQIELLDMAVTAVRRGGVVAYVTCSPDRRETDAVVSAVIERQPVTQMPIGLPAVIPDGESEFGRSVEHPIQLWPHRHDTDAMYIAVLRRDS